MAPTALIAICSAESGGWKASTTEGIANVYRTPLRFCLQFSGRRLFTRRAGSAVRSVGSAGHGLARCRWRVRRAAFPHGGKKGGNQGAHRRGNHGKRFFFAATGK